MTTFMTKQLFLIFVIFLFNNLTNAQSPRLGDKALAGKSYQKGLIMNAYVGSRAFGKVSDSINEAPALSLNAGVGYLFDKWGVIGRTDYYHHFLIPGYKGGRETVTHSLGLSLLGNFRLVPIFGGELNAPWQFDAYIGGGLTTSWNRDMMDFVESSPNFGGWQDPFLSGKDDMGHILIGFTPKYYFNNQIALSLDVSTFMLFAQDFTYDYTERITGEGLGGIMTFSFGVVIKPKF